MQYCKECGEPLTEGSSFCKGCGTPVAPTAKQVSTPPSQPSKPMNPKTKKLIIAGVVLFGVLFGGYKIGENLTSKERKIEKFESALIEKDKGKLAGLFVSTDKKLKIDDKQLNGFMKYLDENPEEAQKMVQTLTQQAQFYDSMDGSLNKIPDYSEELLSEGIVHLRKNGKTLFYDKYEIAITPVYLSLYTNYQDTILKMDGKKIAKADKPDYEKTVGPFLPGIYTVEASLKNDFTTLNDKKEIFLSGNDKQEVEMYLDGEEVLLYSDIEDTDVKGKIVLNGKELKVNPFDQKSFGPVVTDGSLSVQVIADLPWGETKSEEVVIDDDSVQFDLAKDKALQQSIMDTLVKHAREWMDAYTTADTNKFTTVASSKMDDYVESFSEEKENGTLYTGKYLGTNFDLDTLHLYKGDSWKVTINVEELYHSDQYSAGEKPELSDSSADWKYYLVYDEKQKKWLVEDYEGTWGSYGDNIHEQQEKNPKTYTSTWAK